MSPDADDSREQGIEFGPLAERLENETYPLSQEELLSRYGDYELALADGRTPLRSVLSRENTREYESADAVEQAVFAMVGDDAVGPEGYSDRGGNDPGGASPDETDSL